MKNLYLFIFFTIFSLSQFSIFYFFNILQKKIDFLESQLTLLEALLEREILNAQLNLNLKNTQVENDSFLTIVTPYVPYVIGVVSLVILWYFCCSLSSDPSLPGAGGGANLSSQTSVKPNLMITPDSMQEDLISENATSSFLNVMEDANSSIVSDPLLINVPSSVELDFLVNSSTPSFNFSDALSNERFSTALFKLIADNGGTATIDQLRALCRSFGMSNEQINTLEPYALRFVMDSQTIIETAISQV